MKAGATVQRQTAINVSSRGSVLVLVVGVLALMGLIVLVYSTIGVGDRRSSAALVERSRVDESIKSMRDYFAQAIADSAVAVLPQRITGDNTNNAGGTARKSFDILQRKAVDIPWTDPQVRSVPRYRDSVAIKLQVNAAGSATDEAHQTNVGDTANWRKFQVTGGAVQLWDPTNRANNDTDVEPRTPTTPWLAASEPMWIDAGQPRTNGDTTVIANPLDLAKEDRDLLHISNFSPDGRFINKSALRGNLNAESGFGQQSTPGLGSDGKLATSGSMWLLDHDGQPTQRLQRPANGSVLLYANPNIPNHWSANQYGLHRPISFVPKIGADAIVPGDPRFPGNSFADADGDGALDSRYAEFIDSSIPSDSVAVVPSPAGMRFIYAAKVQDLSGLVNVNTATSFARETSDQFPPGLTPSDVDLERLLAMHDAYREFDVTGSVLQSYPNPATGRVSNYEVYDYDLTGSTSAATFGENANLIGRSAFSALVASRAAGDVPPSRDPTLSYFDPDQRVNPNPPIWLKHLATGPDPRDGYMDASSRARSYYFLGRSPGGIAGSGTTIANPSVVELSLNLTFGMADEAELRARNGLNDPSRQTRLELTIDGRSNKGLPTVDLRSYGPMRSNRDAEVETLNIAGPSVRNVAADEQFAMLTATSVRRNMTTTSGARPIRIDPSGLTPVGTITNPLTDGTITPGPITKAEIAPDINALLDTVYTQALSTQEYEKAVNTIFTGYANALMPDAARVNPETGAANKVDVWNADIAQSQGQVVVYGNRFQYQAPPPPNTAQPPIPLAANAAEYALRTSAALTLNLIAQRDPRITAEGASGGYLGTRPADDLVVGTLLVNEAGRSKLEPGVPSVVTDFGGLPTSVNSSVPQWTFWDTSTVAPGTNANDPQAGLIVKLDLNAFDPNQKTSDNKVKPQRLFDSNRLNTAPHRLSVDDPVAIPARVMFGVRPQPFLTQAAMYQMFGNSEWDGISGKGADSRDQEWDPPDPADPLASQFKKLPPTIYCNVKPSNSDFLVEMFAFQLTNPFDVDLPLTKVDPATGKALSTPVGQQEYRYYVEFNGRFFKIVDAEFSDTGAVSSRTAVVLKPGESRTFYALTQSFDDIRKRWQDMGLPSVTNQKIQDWIDRQLETDPTSLGGAGTLGKPIRVVEIKFDPSQLDPTERVPATEPAVNMVNFLSGSVTSADKRVVRLWRDLRTDTTFDGSKHLQQNDYLVDRLREPDGGVAGGLPSDRAVLDCTPFDAAKVTCTGVTTGVPDPRIDADGYAATRLAFTTFASIRRPDDPAGGPPNGIPEGSFPAYCIEAKSKFDQNKLNIKVLPANTPGGVKPDTQAWYGNQLVEGVDVPFGTEAFALPGQTLVERQSVATEHLISSIGKAAARRKNPSDVIPKNKNNSAEGVPFSQLRVATGVTRKIKTGATYALPPLRPADLLSPLAITPTYLPIDGTGATYTEKLNDRWTTLSEALGLATGYDWVDTSLATPTTLAEHERNYAYRFGDTEETTVDKDGRAFRGATHEVSGIVDRGHLVLTRYVPINDSSGNGLFDQYDATTKLADPARGLGVPLAFNILNNFRTTSLGSATSMVPGLINVNTAPRAVLRLLPLLTPDWTKQFSGWMYNANLDGSANKLYDPSKSVWDLASVIAAYRDRTAVITRADNAATPKARAVDFSDTNSADVTAAPGNIYFSTGRRMGANISALRNDAGILSIGELLAARISEKLNPSPDTSPTQSFATRVTAPKDRADLSIDRFGRMNVLGAGSTVLAPKMAPPTNPNTDTSTGVVTSLVMPTSGGTGAVPVEVPDSYEQQLSIANAVMNLVTTRSDVFCVWFVVEGYAAGDVEGLKVEVPANESSPTILPSDPDYDSYARPMTPSVSRRYMMVVDRSNVTAQGQKPRILLFEELPR